MPSVESMTVRVLFFSTLKDLIGKSELPVELPAQSVVGDLMEQLVNDHRETKEAPPRGRGSVRHDWLVWVSALAVTL